MTTLESVLMFFVIVEGVLVVWFFCSCIARHTDNADLRERLARACGERDNQNARYCESEAENRRLKCFIVGKDFK